MWHVVLHGDEVLLLIAHIGRWLLERLRLWRRQKAAAILKVVGRRHIVRVLRVGIELVLGERSLRIKALGWRCHVVGRWHILWVLPRRHLVR